MLKSWGISITKLKMSFFYTAIIAPIAGLVAPVEHLLTPLIGLVFIDIATGMYKNRIVKGQAISSRRFADKLKPLLLWAVGLLTMLFSDTFLHEINITGNWAAKGYCVFYAMYETISILENLGECGLPAAKGILKLLKGKLPSNINDALEESEKDDDTK